MSKISLYSHYYLNDIQIEALRRDEIWAAYILKGFRGLLSFELEWFKQFWPEKYRWEICR